MGKAITADRGSRLFGVYLNNVTWEGVDDDLVEWALQNPKEAGAEFVAFLKNRGRCQIVVKQFKVWKELTVYPQTENCVTELEQAGDFVSDYAKSMMAKPEGKTTTAPCTLTLARSTVRDLGFTETPTTDELWARIQELGGELCPSEAGPALRKEYRDQPNGEAVWLAMKQITGLDGYPRVFEVRRREDGERWLDGRYAYPGRRWSLDYVVVFVLRE